MFEIGLIILSSLTSLILGFFVIGKNSKNKLNVYFFIFSLITGSWIASNLFIPYFLLGNFWLKTAYALGLLVAPSALIWILYLIYGERFSKIKLALLLIPAPILFSLIYIDDLLIRRVDEVIIGGFKG